MTSRIAPTPQADPAAPMRLADAAALFGLTAGALRTEARPIGATNA